MTRVGQAAPASRSSFAWRCGAAILFSALVLGCASLQMQPASLTPYEGNEQSLTLERDVDIRFDTGYTRTLRAGTRMVLAGTLQSGKVYRLVDAVLTVEGTHMHEGWLVIDGEKLVGYYLPVEKSFVAQGSAPALRFKR